MPGPADVFKHPPPLAMHYTVLLEGIPPLGGADLVGPFSGCSGLEAHYEEFQWKEGGDNGTVVRLPGRLVPGTVTLSHQVSESSAALRQWFLQTSKTMFKGIAVITLFTGDGEAVANWTLQDAWPVRYVGPTLTTSPSGESIAVETIDLAHGGLSA
ncbi:MAG TPA: phage tail protein [Jatrophihabitantaceae bacterium]|nr:phage tail protein [Jatrophihabitantaceae bacterium]